MLHPHIRLFPAVRLTHTTSYGQKVPFEIEPSYMGPDEGPDTQVLFTIATEDCPSTYTCRLPEVSNDRGEPLTYAQMLLCLPKQNRFFKPKG